MPWPVDHLAADMYVRIWRACAHHSIGVLILDSPCLARRQVVDCIDGSSDARILQGGMAGGLLSVHGSLRRAAESGEEFDGCMHVDVVRYAQIMHEAKQLRETCNVSMVVLSV